MSSSEEEVGITFLYAGSESSDEQQLAIDENVPAGSLVPNSPSFLDSNVVGSEGDECVRRTLEEVATSNGRAEEASEADSFVDIVGSVEKENGGE